MLDSRARFLVGSQSFGTELGTNLFNHIGFRGLNIIEGIIQFEFIPFKSAHLMKR